MSEREALVAELEAANRTIAALKERVVSLQSGASSVIQRQLEAARQREEENRSRRVLMDYRTRELARYSKTLVAESAARNLAMRRILNNVTFGFLIVNAELFVQPECTDSCSKLLEAPVETGASLPRLLRLTGDAEAMYRACAWQVFEDLLPEDVALEQMRTTFRIGARTIRAEPRVVRGVLGKVEGLLYTLSDISELLAAHAESARSERLVAILRSWDSFVVFVQDSRTRLARAEARLDDDEEAVRRELHTVKGNAAAFDLVDLVEVIHEAEEGAIGKREIDRARDVLDDFLKLHADVLGRGLAQERLSPFAVSEAQLVTLRSIASEVESDALDAWVATIAERPARAMLGPIESFGARLGTRLGKAVEVVVQGGDTPLDSETMGPIMLTVTHLVRNAISHGIEYPEIRGPKGPTGRVTVAIDRGETAYTLCVSDDGAGIDVERVTRTAVLRRVVSPLRLATMTDEEKLALVYQDGVSTASEVSDISGRGVGLSAVLAEVRAAGGRVEVTSERGRGTTFRLEIPRRSVAQRISVSRRSGIPPRTAAPST